MDGYDPPHGYWGSSPRPREEYPLLWPAEQPLQLPGLEITC